MTSAKSEPQLGSALTSDPELLQTVCSALEHSDGIVIIAEMQGTTLRIVAMNAEAQRATGYAGHQLAGQEFTRLAGPETDPSAVAALHAAARQNQPHQTQIRCHNAEGRPFWFGLHLMPANGPGAPRRFLILGRDITKQLREREQDQAVQSLLAKVFIASDLPVYILDQHGRFLMTNPALDRLLGCTPGSLCGTIAIERYAPHCHAALAAAWAKQDTDGLEYTVDAVLLGTGGSEIPCSVTGIMVRRADLPRLQMMMVRTDRSKPAMPSITAGGCIQLIGLEEVRHILGPRWDALKDRAMAMAEHVVRRQLGPADTFSRTDDQAFALCFAGATEEEASFRSAAIAREVRRRLIGEGESADVAHVFSAATSLPAAADSLPAIELAAIVRDRVARTLSTMQETARTRLLEALKTATYDTEVVRARGRDEGVGVLLRIPQATERAVEAAIAVLPGTETASLDTDAMLLGFAYEYATKSAAQNRSHLIFVFLSSDILLIRKRMEACVDACRAIPERLRQQLVLIVAAPPESAARQLSSGLLRLRPFCRSLGVGLETLDPIDLDVHAQGLAILLIDASACEQVGWEAKVKARRDSLQTQRCRLMVRGATLAKMARLFAGGADLVSIESTVGSPRLPLGACGRSAGP